MLGGTVQPSAFALGMSSDSIYETQKDQIALGDRLLLFTDGLCDFEGEAVLMRDDPKFLALVAASAEQEGQALLNGIVDRVKEFSGEANFFDDVCLVSVEWTRPF